MTAGGSPDRWAEVDLRAVRGNVAALRGLLPAATRLLAVVKADGYGHGAEPAGRAALEGGAAGLAVSTLAEARALLGLAGAERLLVMGGLVPDAAREAIETRAAVVCSSPELARALAQAADPRRPLQVHLKVDTGMGRLGCRPEEAPALAALIAGAPGLQLAGTMTHFAAAEADEEFTRTQFTRFLAVLDGLGRLGLDPGLRHACNSAAALRHPEMALDAVRVGIAIYGCQAPGLAAALSLRARITHLKALAAGESVGYGRTWRAPGPALVGIIAIGYEDGVDRARSNSGWALVRGCRAPLVGTVSMDALAVDVSGIPGVAAGDVVTLIGADGPETVTAEQVAAWSGTISHEVLTSIGGRVPRIYQG